MDQLDQVWKALLKFDPFFVASSLAIRMFGTSVLRTPISAASTSSATRSAPRPSDRPASVATATPSSASVTTAPSGGGTGSPSNRTCSNVWHSLAQSHTKSSSVRGPYSFIQFAFVHLMRLNQSTWTKTQTRKMFVKTILNSRSIGCIVVSCDSFVQRKWKCVTKSKWKMKYLFCVDHSVGMFLFEAREWRLGLGNFWEESKSSQANPYSQ